MSTTLANNTDPFASLHQPSFGWIGRPLLSDVVSSAQIPVSYIIVKVIGTLKEFYVVSPLRRFRLAAKTAVALVCRSKVSLLPTVWLDYLFSKSTQPNLEFFRSSKTSPISSTLDSIAVRSTSSCDNITGKSSTFLDTIPEKSESCATISLSLDSIIEKLECCASLQVESPCSDFEYLRVIGEGAFGKVYLCREKTTGNYYAMKIISKKTVRNLRHIEHSLAERRILELSHPFIVKMHCSFETINHLNIALEYCPGGDMFSLLDRYGRFTERMATFYSAAIFSAMVHLHDNGVLYRDLKPENILIDVNGFPRLADFGLSKEGIFPGTTTKSFCGSEDYIAPEVIIGGGYDKAADLWSFGCLVYEMLTGFPPFYSGKDRLGLFEKIKAGRVSYPSYLSQSAYSLISGLLNVDSSQRLGSKNSQELIDHPFFENIDWYSLLTKQLVPPYRPMIQGSLDVAHFTSQCSTHHLIEARENKLANDGDFVGFDWNIGQM